MKNIKVLDCTLRDGGYCNQWQFGEKNIKRILNGLVDANIDIIECGFLTNKMKWCSDISKFNNVETMGKFLPARKQNKSFVCMMNYGEYDINDLPNCEGSSIDGIRLAFHKKDLNNAMEDAMGIMNKGYKVFIQAMVSLSYSDEEFLGLIKKCNTINPYSFYIVDSFGVMKQKDLIRMFYMIEHNLNDGITIGFHSHNNMQLSYSNAQALVNIQSNKDLIIDASIFGMGRGAGNLNTELFVEYLNDNANGSYESKPLLSIIDDILNHFYFQNYWGYSLPNYLSAKHNLHPNYASYLSDKQTLTVDNIDDIFSMVEESKKNSYDGIYIEKLYFDYLALNQENENHLNDLIRSLKNKKVLIIAPGKSVEDEKEKIVNAASRANVLSIGVNFNYFYFETNYIFLSNLRRCQSLKDIQPHRIIATSNIPENDIYLKLKYKKLLNNVKGVQDNAGMMLIQFLISLGVKEILLAGFDGYSHDASENFADSELEFSVRNSVFDMMNKGIETFLNSESRNANFEFITSLKNIKPKFKREDKK